MTGIYFIMKKKLTCIRKVILGPIRSANVTGLVCNHEFAVTPMEPMFVDLGLK